MQRTPNEAHYQPLRAVVEDKKCEHWNSQDYESTTRGLTRKLLHWFRQCLKPLRPTKLSEERVSVQKQVEIRQEFPTDEWLATELPLANVSEILNLLQQRMNWPNKNFLPSDPLRLLLLQEYDEFASYEFFLDLRDHLSISLTSEEIEHFCREGQTLESFVRDVTFRLHAVPSGKNP